MVASTSSLASNCQWCSVALNITENEKPFSCEKEHIFTCQHCTNLLIKPLCLDCRQQTVLNQRIYDDIFNNLREYYQSNSYTFCLVADTNKQLLQKDINMRMKPFNQLIRVAKQFPLDQTHTYNERLMRALNAAEEMQKNFDQLCEFLKNETVDLAAAKREYQKICGVNCDSFILNCEYLQAIHQAARQQALLPNLFLLTEKMCETKNGNFDGSCKTFLQQLVLDMKSAVNIHEEKAKLIRVGLIGNAKQGKSSLCNYLRGMYKKPNTNGADQHNYAAIGANEVTSLCTVCYIYDYHDEESGEKYSIEFIDLAGGIGLSGDDDSHYKNEFKKADCDVYLVIRRGAPFSIHEFRWKRFIEDECHRKCLFVQTGADATFAQKFGHYYGDQEFVLDEPNAKEKFDEVINDMRRHALDCLTTDHRIHVKMEDIYFVGCPFSVPADINDPNKFHVQFDLGKLRSEIFKIANDENWPRLKRDILTAASFFISVHYKRNHKISVLRETLGASICSIIPFLDVWATKSSKKKIYEEFGLNEDLINYLGDLAEKHKTTIQTVTSANNNFSTLDVAANAFKTMTGVGSAVATFSAVGARATGVAGGVLASALIPAAVFMAIAQAGWTAFLTKKELEDCILTACEYIETTAKYIADLLFETKITKYSDVTATT